MGKRSTSSQDKRKQKMLKERMMKHPELLSGDPESSKAGAAIDKKMMKQPKLLSGELESSKAGDAIGKKTIRFPEGMTSRLLSGLPESRDDESCEDITDERSDDNESRMLMRVAVETLRENKLLRHVIRGKLSLKVPEGKIGDLLNMVQADSEVQMNSDIGFEELKQVEAAAKYIYVRKMFKVEDRDGEKFMQIPHDKKTKNVERKDDETSKAVKRVAEPESDKKMIKRPKLLSGELESSKVGAAIDRKTFGFPGGWKSKLQLNRVLESSKVAAAIDRKTFGFPGGWTSSELLSMTPRVVTDKKVVRRCEDITDERSDNNESRMKMRFAVENLKENMLLRVCGRESCLKVPEEKIDHLLKMVQTKSEVQMNSDIGFEELKQIEAAAKYIYVRNMFHVWNHGGKKFMLIPHYKMRRRAADYGEYRFRFYGS
ncbi:hypothetical protein CASFOL_034202 [Castilleja foliolosa]|uniref:Uncharacterized protein n=1 Tax=Castilleja foliolosa TaxID=1961234 RepID=A0ABD3BY27_9LAMI